MEATKQPKAAPTTGQNIDPTYDTDQYGLIWVGHFARLTNSGRLCKPARSFVRRLNSCRICYEIRPVCCLRLCGGPPSEWIQWKIGCWPSAFPLVAAN